MKIAYISKSIIPSRSANSVQVMKMCEAFAKNGHKVILYCRAFNNQTKNIYKYYGVEKCFKMKKQIFSDIKERKWISGENKNNISVQKELPDLFYGRDDLKNFLRIAPLGRPIALEVHDPPRDTATKKYITKLISYKNFKCLIVTSNALRREYLNLFPHLREKILVAHNGSNLPATSQIQNEKLQLLGRNTKIKIGYVGHLYPGKGMEIIEQLAARLPNIDFHVIGGTEEDIKRCTKAADHKNIIFYGFVPHGLLEKYYSVFDIVLAPYQNKVKTFGGNVDNSKWICPLKIFDYMAHSKTIIASNTILKDVLYDRMNCLTCPPQDVEAWLKATLELLNDSQLRTRLADTAYNDFLTHYTWTKRADKILELF